MLILFAIAALVLVEKRNGDMLREDLNQQRQILQQHEQRIRALEDQQR